MNVFVTGRGTSGSWIIRGEQLGAAIGANVQKNATSFNGAEAIIVVKRVRPEYLEPLLSSRAPIVWDIVDAWPQPVGNEWSRPTCLEWLRTEIKVLRPAALVVSTQRMLEDCEEFKLPTLVLPHHGRPGQDFNPIRPEVRHVGYEGGEHYLGEWRAIVAKECAAHGWKFWINPPKLSDVDILVALRESNGYAAKNWKSNVKLANAQGSGTPCVLNRERAYVETAKLGVAWADDPVELKFAFRVLSDYQMRKATAERLLASRPSLQDLAETYSEWLRTCVQ